jgi:surface antigen
MSASTNDLRRKAPAMIHAIIFASPATGENHPGPALVRGHPARRLGSRALLALSVPALLGVIIAAPASAQTGPDLGSQLNDGATMTPGQYLQSPGGQYRLYMQSDGNLVEYNAAGAPLWDPPPPTQSVGHPGAFAVLQNDGNFVVYPQAGPLALWASYTQNNPGDHLSLQDDGNLVIYSAAGAPLWATMSGAVPRGTPGTGDYYAPGQCTWYADQEAHAYTGVWLPNYLGNAMYWAANAARDGWATGYTPRIGSVIVFWPGADGASRSDGHVAWVTAYYPSTGKVIISEMNGTAGPGRVDSRTISDGINNPMIRYIYMNP